MFTKAIVVQSYERLPRSHVEEAACAQVPRACATPRATCGLLSEWNPTRRIQHPNPPR